MPLFLKPHCKTLFVDLEKKFSASKLKYSQVGREIRINRIAGKIRFTGYLFFRPYEQDEKNGRDSRIYEIHPCIYKSRPVICPSGQLRKQLFNFAPCKISHTAGRLKGSR